jgi:hypothetical protein
MNKRMEFVSMKQNPDQYVLPYDAAKNDLLAQLRLLRSVDLGLSAGRSEGVIQLLERLALLGNDLTEHAGRVRVKAQVIAIAAKCSRNTVSDRTVRNWQTDAVELGFASWLADRGIDVATLETKERKDALLAYSSEFGILHIDIRSHRYGRKEWNVYTINLNAIRSLVRRGAIEGGSGRKWAAMVAAPGPETIAAPRAETIAAPLHCISTRETQQQLTVATASVAVATAQPVVVVSFEDVLDKCGCLNPARTLRNAREILKLSNSEIEERIAAFKARPENQQDPGVLHNWLSTPRSYRQQPSKAKAEPQRRYVDPKLAAGLRETRIFNQLRTRLGRPPYDNELKEALQNEP